MKKNTGFTRIVKAGFYSYKGFTHAFKFEAAFRQEIYAAVVMVPLAVWLANTAVERVLLVGAVLWVLVIELLNSGIEAVVDRIGPEYHELAGRAKDMGSAAVLMSIVLCIWVWASLLWPRISFG